MDGMKACLYDHFWNKFDQPTELISDHGTWQHVNKVCLSQYYVLPELVVCQITASQLAIQKQGAVQVCMRGDQLWLCKQ